MGDDIGEVIGCKFRRKRSFEGSDGGIVDKGVCMEEGRRR